MSLSGEAEALASKIGSSHSGTTSSTVLSDAGAKVENLQAKLGAENPESEHHPLSSDSPKLPASKDNDNEPEAKQHKPKQGVRTDKDSNVHNKDEKKEEDKGIDKSEKEGGKRHDNKEDADGKDDEKKALDAGEKDKKHDDSEDKGTKGKDNEDKDAKGGGTGSKEKPDTKESNKADKKDQKKDDKEVQPPAPPSPKSLGVDDFLASPPEKASKFEEKDRKWEADGYTATNGLDAFAQKHEASQLGEAEWLEVLDNCNAMYGWCIDGPMKQIVRAPKPAFQLKAVKPPEKPLNSSATQSNDTHSDAVSGDSQGTSTTTSSPGTRTPASSAAISPSSSGDQSQKQLVPGASNRATTIDAMRSSVTVTVGAKDAQISIVPASVQQNSPAVPAPASQASVPGVAKTTPKSKKPTRVLPEFSVNDNSRIDIAISSHEFQTSMATNDFSAASTSASLGGSYGPISASVSYSTESTHSSSTSNTSDTYHKTMIAKYMFPRVDLHLDSCLEPTEGLKEAIAKVEATKNIKDLRQLRRDYGYLFCKAITIGGRLQTQALMDQSSTSSEQEQKQSLKTSVGLAVSSPEASGSVSHTEESGSDNSSSQAQSNKSESHAFEAMGGDSLLASNPMAWIPTVGTYKNWRIINRDGLILMSDMISGLSGFEHTRSWFEQAVPSLSKYIEFSDKLVKKIRLRLMSPNHNLCLSCKRDSDDADFAVPPNYYFGHRPLSTVMPLAMELEHPDVPWGRIQMPNGKPEFLFSPGSYRAPAIYGYSANKVGVNLYGTKYDDEYRSTVWSITSPYDDALCHESRVIIQTISPGNKSNASITGDSGNNTLSIATSTPMVSSLVVFRNQQGVFLPAMSDTKDIHVWRIMKSGAAPGDKVNIAEGDQVQLAWCFQDQFCGYRDFTQDAFGRRRNGPPPESKSSVLYMRLPWPRFEPVESLSDQVEPLPNTLVMSEVIAPQDNPSNTLPDKIQVIRDLKQTTKDIIVENCIFRLDVVKRHGRGDVDDYLLRGVSQEATFPDVIKREELEKKVEEEEKVRAAREEAERRAMQEEERENKSAGEVVPVGTAVHFADLTGDGRADDKGAVTAYLYSVRPYTGANAGKIGW
ncbi:hypothetical protein FBEOM_13532 [Fusarium beomiforme]|uniref:MACPF-like domain-containing protein n=1 Tax=Fusarium beomiforme TaxID=44412 RepID=A0A9P5A5N7_9HYPO|nr:hypothetical protein FBEOM_13532 [Fusarium beomiforme]